MTTRKLRKLLVQLESDATAPLDVRVERVRMLESFVTAAKRERSAAKIDGDVLLRVATQVAAVQRDMIEALRQEKPNVRRR